MTTAESIEDPPIKSPAASGGQALYPVQSILLPHDMVIRDLYFRVVHGDAGFGAAGISLESKCRISSNTYFNSFYEVYWAEFAPLGDLYLSLTLAGDGSVEVYREVEEHGTHRVAIEKIQAASPTRLTIPIAPARLTAPGRLFFDIEAKKKLIVSDIEFLTDRPPVRQPRVSVLIEGGQDEKALGRTVSALSGQLATDLQVESLTVLNRGKPFSDRSLIRALESSPKVRVAKWPKAAGDESLLGPTSTDSAVTSYLVSAGDVQVDPLIVGNLLNFLGYTDEEVVVGAQTLNPSRPWMLRGSEGVITGEEETSAEQNDVDLRELASLSRFISVSMDATEQPPLCVVPKNFWGEGPMDEENGLLGWLWARGIKSIAPPGIAVWHAPTESKEADVIDTTKSALSKNLFPLQNVLMPHDMAIGELYFRTVLGESKYSKGGIVLEPGCRLSSNTYFNSFYESYWTEFARLDNLYLAFTFEGEGRLEVFRDTATQGCQRIVRQALPRAKATRVAVLLPPARVTQAGRIFFDIEVARRSRISSIEFLTDRAPSRETRLTIGICTFNREEFVAQNVAAITERFETDPGLVSTIVVNQGKPFKDALLNAAIEQSSKVRVVEQRNLGGCGGFTRSMMESLTYPTANYHLLMDDDVQLDPMIVANLMHFIAYLKEEIVIGGHMLDLLRPWVLYEAGATVHESGNITPLHHNIDLRGLESLSRFNKASSVHYNAWWFCAIPSKWIEKAQLPAPIFIRGDDMEFGIRLGELGVKTVAMPGIGVWHEPFYLKVGSWQTYYDYRNRLIMASAYPERFKLESPKKLNWVMMRSLAVHDYQQAALISEAIMDYLKGPSLFETDAAVIHERIGGVAKKFAPKSLSEEGELPPIKERPLPKNRMGRLWLVFRRLLACATLRPGTVTYLVMDSQVHPAHIGLHPYVKTNGIRSYFLRYAPDRAKLMLLLKKCRAAYREYDGKREQIARDWAKGIAHFRQPETWQKIVGE